MSSHDKMSDANDKKAQLAAGREKAKENREKLKNALSHNPKLKKEHQELKKVLAAAKKELKEFEKKILGSENADDSDTESSEDEDKPAEKPVDKVKRQTKCGLCGLVGHTKRKCPSKAAGAGDAGEKSD